MRTPSRAPSEAVVICTRNRPAALTNTLRSVAEQSGAPERMVVVVDGSDPTRAYETEQVVWTWGEELPFHYHRFEGDPAGTRQRNAGVHLLPGSVSLVHFIDDDVTLKPSYFQILADALRQYPSLLGVGGIVIPDHGRPLSSASILHRLFLLGARRPSRVLPSGHTSSARPLAGQSLQPAEWLSTCASSYRRAVFQEHTFDPTVEGPSPRFEDLDFSYRVAQDGPLAVLPAARCIHHASPTNRRSLTNTVREQVVRRYWFVEKNLRTPLSRLAFWWSMLGRLLILAASSNPASGRALRGFLRGVQSVWTRSHELLNTS